MQPLLYSVSFENKYNNGWLFSLLYGFVERSTTWHKVLIILLNEWYFWHIYLYLAYSSSVPGLHSWKYWLSGSALSSDTFICQVKK